VNPVLLWFHQLGSPARFDAFAARWAPLAFLVALPLLALGSWGALLAVPADANQGEVFRIFYVHVPSAWMSLFIYGVMAVQAFIALVWRIKLCELLMLACAPVGALFTAITLATGSIWGRPTWGTWWTWDPRLTSELVLLFLYFGVIGLHAAIEDRRTAARAAGFLALVGLVNVPVVHFAVDWWNTLHQGATVRLLGPDSMHSSMQWPLWTMVVATKAWFIASLLQRARQLNLAQSAGQDWTLAQLGADR
jgi:heme exporter protein C